MITSTSTLVQLVFFFFFFAGSSLCTYELYLFYRRKMEYTDMVECVDLLPGKCALLCIYTNVIILFDGQPYSCHSHVNILYVQTINLIRERKCSWCNVVIWCRRTIMVYNTQQSNTVPLYIVYGNQVRSIMIITHKSIPIPYIFV